MERTAWAMPQTIVQKFVADEYVSACIVGQIACAIPGTNRYSVTDGYHGDQDNRMFSYNINHSQWSGPYINKDGNLHGVCGNWANISFDGSKASGHEVVNGVTDPNRVIYGIEGYEERTGEFNVTWHSYNADPSDVYNHYGVLRINYIDNEHPNHS